MIKDVYTGSWMPDPRSEFFPSQIQDPGVKIAPDPGSATLVMLVIREYITSSYGLANSQTGASTSE
jgi:hypothetical protein